MVSCAATNKFDRLNDGKVYRVIRPDENPLSGISSLNPDNIKTVAGHVTSVSRSPSQFISATKDLDIAQKWAGKTGNRIVEIDLTKVPSGAIDISSPKGLDLLGNQFARRLAKGSSEVLFDAPIPAGAINTISALEYIHSGRMKLNDILYSGTNPYSITSRMDYETRRKLTANQMNARGKCSG